ncbi:MAG: CopG family ribbon-helix-helix protein [Candidatus Poseidoniaceae archaeon]|tara:strand:+ start:384 stop:812 length:429 start_codon:yes stop_codon:yes gene_type:complete
MSKIISFSSDDKFSNNLDAMIKNSGYNNRSRFLRDAAIYFAEIQQRGELMNMGENEIVEGHLVVYYEHGTDQKLMVSRTKTVEVAAYHHSSRLGHSCHSCVDVVHVKGAAKHVRGVFEQLNSTASVDKVSFISAPMDIEDCC